MKSLISSLLTAALLLTQHLTASAQTDTDTLANSPPSPPQKWTYRKWNGSNYACKCYAGDACWPNTSQWSQLNSTVGGNLRVTTPPGAPCYNTFQGPLGNVSTYNAAQCTSVTAGFPSEQFQIDLPIAGLWSYFTNDTCRPTTSRTDTCTLGHYPVLVIMAKTTGHIQAGINFARDNNLRLIIRNTGHDFLGRSVGWGALVINTHSFQDAITALNKAHALTPPKIMITGECATVGVAGGLPQGGGHGPWTTLKGFLADTALEFEVITADGQLLTTNANTNSDLFWALRGGGPAAFAVIVSASYKTFDDVPSTGTTLNINTAHTTNSTLFWQAFTAFHGYSNYFTEKGLYVYYEVGTTSLHVQPFLAIGKNVAQLQAILKPLFDDLDAMGLMYDTTTKTYSTYYDLYFDMFEGEMAGNSALTGGWTMGKADVANNNAGIVSALRNAANNGAILVGHMWNAGQGVPASEWNNTSVNPKLRQVSEKIITVVIVSGNAPLSMKAAAQQKLTYVVDAGLRAAAPNGAAYINEADPHQPNWQQAFWGTNYPALLKLRQKWDPAGVFYAVSTPGTENWEQIEWETRLCKKVQ
ncbi:hypothetical protein B0T17DRAFT_587300 [Bombardia bombarda]|uniref:FAD-binding PCMH-type domain-containing protein n=1 Tax=Bombardia bombarda TaxID=252184 RepID=A0AA39XL08_9PEZI|nr:hypothetical protein B0T17DRAFT_587300 [Bombardia bombarda]